MATRVRKLLRSPWPGRFSTCSGPRCSAACSPPHLDEANARPQPARAPPTGPARAPLIVWSKIFHLRIGPALKTSQQNVKLKCASFYNLYNKKHVYNLQRERNSFDRRSSRGQIIITKLKFMYDPLWPGQQKVSPPLPPARYARGTRKVTYSALVILYFKIKIQVSFWNGRAGHTSCRICHFRNFW